LNIFKDLDETKVKATDLTLKAKTKANDFENCPRGQGHVIEVLKTDISACLRLCFTFVCTMQIQSAVSSDEDTPLCRVTRPERLRSRRLRLRRRCRRHKFRPQFIRLHLPWRLGSHERLCRPQSTARSLQVTVIQRLCLYPGISQFHSWGGGARISARQKMWNI